MALKEYQRAHRRFLAAARAYARTHAAFTDEQASEIDLALAESALEWAAVEAVRAGAFAAKELGVESVVQEIAEEMAAAAPEHETRR